MKEIINNIFKKVIIFVLLLASIVGIHTISTASVSTTSTAVTKNFNKQTMMPERDPLGPSGMFPQYYVNGAVRTVTLDDNRWTLPTWNATMSGKVVYCSAYGRYVRFGEYNTSPHYLIPGETKIQGYTINQIDGQSLKAQVSKDDNTAKELAQARVEELGYKYYAEDEEELLSSKNTVEVIEVTYKDEFGQDLNQKAISYVITPDFIKQYGGSNENITNAVSLDMMGNMYKILDQLGNDMKKVSYSPSIDGDLTQDKDIVNANIGPEVIVLEHTEKTGNGYGAGSGTKFVNNQKAYIFSAAENVYGNGNYSQKYTLNDIQGAYWRVLRQEGDSKPTEKTTNHITANAENLYKKSKEYAQFLIDTKDEYKCSVKAANSLNTTEAQVIVDRAKKEYIVGPFTLDYPTYKDKDGKILSYYEDISYVKSLVINDKLVYDDKNQDFNIVLEGQGIQQNGMVKKYPMPGENFFIVVSADKLGIDTTELKLKANFEHINYTCAEVDTTLTADANVYRYYGYYSANPYSQYKMTKGRVEIKYKFLKAESVLILKHEDHCTIETNYVCNCNPQEVPDYKNDFIEMTYGMDVYQPYLKMGTEKVGRADAQTLIVVGNAEREYVLKSAEIEKNIDLTMELGGHVWLDVDGGKEDISNGVYDKNENRIPNVPVTLYRQDGVKIAETKTLNKETDINGDGKTTAPYEWVGAYYFKGLNPMYQYYVEFTYNGQYYQATTFKDSSNWYDSDNWSKTSNAKEKRQDRIDFNAKFESIGASPKNYETTRDSGNYNETFTKLELLGFTLQSDGLYKQTREAVIDCKWKCGEEASKTHIHEERCIDVVYGNLILESSEDATTQKMIQYVKDCMIKSSTNADGEKGLYPVPSFFVIDNIPVSRDYKEVFHDQPAQLYDKAYYINLGLDERQEADIALIKDVSKVTLEINGQSHDYKYETILDENGQKLPWDISVRLADSYYDTSYIRKLYESDYAYKVNLYGDTDANNDGIGDKYGKSVKDELEVFVTYVIVVGNQDQSIQIKVNEIADYYDQDFEYIEDRSYIEVKDGGKTVTKPVNAKTDSVYDVSETKINEYNNLYIRDLNDRYLEAGETARIYLTFKVKKDAEGFVNIDEDIKTGKLIGVGKENIAEIMGYSTRYAKGTKVPNVVEDVGYTAAGIVDRDSKPGNIKDTSIKKDNTNKEVYTKFEDDNDKSPNIVLQIDRDDDEARLISGNVWEDLRDEYNPDQETRTGDGIRKENENTLINGVTVQLVELMDNGSEYVWREFGDKGYTIDEFYKLPQEQQKHGIGGLNTEHKGTGTGLNKSETPILNNHDIVKNYEFASKHDGEYVFKSFVPGKYVVRFIYGDTVKTVVPKSLNMGGENAKSYNGQDYKSTTYQEGIDQNNTYIWRYESTWENGKETLGKERRTISTYDKSKCNQNETWTYLYDIAASDKNANVSDAKDIESRRNEVNEYSTGGITNYMAEVLAAGETDDTFMNDSMNDRKQLLNDLMQNTYMKAETGVIVMEVEYNSLETDGTKGRTYKLQNVNLGLEERPKAQIMIDKQVSNAKITLANGTVLFDASNTVSNVLWKDHKEYKNSYDKGIMNESIFGNLQNIRNQNKEKFGLVQISLDEELMHGATMQITYTITAVNIGEIDYHDNSFYYTGKASNTNNVVKSNAKQIIDYVENNLQFSENINKDWIKISKEDIKSNGLVNEKLFEKLEEYNTIITTTKIDEDLVPTLYKTINSNSIDRSSVQLVLTKVLTPENDSDTLTYRNIVEIVKVSNTAGRRMEFSVVGNQDPTQEPQELDSDKAEVVKILPPFGNAGIYIIITITAILALGIIILGTIFIKKKVLRK